MSESTAGSGPPPATSGPDHSTPGRPPKIWQVIVAALVAVVFTAAFMGIYGVLNKAIWQNDYVGKAMSTGLPNAISLNNFVTDHRWTIPAGVLFFSLLVGLAQQYVRAPTVIHGGFVESIKGTGPQIDYRTLPGTLLTAFCSLLSGASTGPEGCVTFLVQQISSWMRERLKIAERTAKGFDVAALSSALNGIIGSPLFTGVFATEFQIGGSGSAALVLLIWNLLAGAIGFLFYALLGLTSFAKFMAFTPITTLRVEYVLYAIILGVLGALVTILMGFSMQVFGRLMAATFKDRVIVRALAAGVVISIVGLLIPQVLFSGEDQIHGIVADPAHFGVLLLLVMAILKILLLGLSLKSGYIGGPTFPILFSCTMVALAASLLFPHMPISILVGCIEAPALALALSAPFTAILLVAVIGGYAGDANMIALLIVATVVGLIVGTAFKQAVARRTARQTAAQPQAAAAAPR
jgi:H+/Cl- antiporter ClcA